MLFCRAWGNGCMYLAGGLTPTAVNTDNVAGDSRTLFQKRFEFKSNVIGISVKNKVLGGAELPLLKSFVAFGEFQYILKCPRKRGGTSEVSCSKCQRNSPRLKSHETVRPRVMDSRRKARPA